MVYNLLIAFLLIFVVFVNNRFKTIKIVKNEEQPAEFERKFLKNFSRKTILQDLFFVQDLRRFYHTCNRQFQYFVPLHSDFYYFYG